MSIHFAASRRLPGSTLGYHLTVPGCVQAVNDNHGAGERMLVDNPLLRATLEHFADFGLAAAAQARSNAEDAFLSENGDAYRHWIAVCRMLDRRMANRLARGR